VKLFAWLKRLRRRESEGPAARSGNYTVRYLAADGTERPTAAGARQRQEQEAVGPGTVETRWYRLRPERLVRLSRQGTDAAGAPYLLRVSYWPWGQESVRLEKYVRDGQPGVEYRRYFENGDLKVHKQLVGRQLVEDFAYQHPPGEYTYVESMPVYPGGQEQLLHDIGRLVKYPASALRNREAGKVFVHFVVGRNGRIGDVRVQKGVSPALDAAAVQVLYAIAQQWRPGFQNRRAVSVSYTVPITFAIN
jgi:TonB family protein